MSIQASMPSRRVGKLERPGCTIHYEVTGSGPAIVFAHGLGGNHLSWWQQVAHFAPHYTCVAFAHRGFAPSDRIAGGPDAADYRGDPSLEYLNSTGSASMGSSATSRIPALPSAPRIYASWAGKAGTANRTRVGFRIQNSASDFFALAAHVPFADR